MEYSLPQRTALFLFIIIFTFLAIISIGALIFGEIQSTGIYVSSIALVIIVYYLLYEYTRKKKIKVFK